MSNEQTTAHGLANRNLTRLRKISEFSNNFFFGDFLSVLRRDQSK